MISPLLANVYLHYVFDLWVQHWRKHRATGEVIVVRYADDSVLGFQYRADAERFLQEWKERLQKFGLELHPDKAKLKQVKDELRTRMHQPLAEVGKWLRSVIQGYFNYHAVPGNSASLQRSRREVSKRWLRVLQRRSQKSRISWKRMTSFAEQWLPRPKILHPYPYMRFDAKYLR